MDYTRIQLSYLPSKEQVWLLGAYMYYSTKEMKIKKN